MVNHDPLLGEGRNMQVGQNTNFEMRNSQNPAINYQDLSSGTFQSHAPNVNINPVDINSIALGEEVSRGFFMNPSFDYDEMPLPTDRDEDEQVSESGSKYNVVDPKTLCTDENGEPVIDLEDDGTVDIHVRQLLTPQEADLSFSEDNILAAMENGNMSESLELIAHQSPEIESQYIITSPIVQTRTVVPTLAQELVVGQEFPDVKSCRRALRETAIAMHFEIQTVKSDKTRFTAKCASEGCPWRVHAAKLAGVPNFSIRTIHSDHNCGGIDHLGHQQASVNWVANSVEERLRENPHCKPKEILEEIHRVHGITLSYKQAWRGKERFMAFLRGSFEDDYRLLPRYCHQIKHANPGSIASVHVNLQDDTFHRLFISYQASIFGFLNACRPLIGLDRTVLKNKYLGTMLFATGFDGEGALFPLAFGIVDEENEEHWMWFISELHYLLETNTENMHMLTILSDRQKSIVDAVDSNFPTAFHGFCMKHLSESFRRDFNNTLLVNLLWEAANAQTPTQFDMKISEIEEISQDAACWVRRVPPRLWANAHFEGTRFGHLTANIIESINSWIVEASSLPIVQMMECIRRQLMTWFNERREASMQWTSLLVPSTERQVSEALERARTYQVLRANEAEFEVISHEGTNIVDIRNRYCSCRGWQLYGVPCSHAVAALLSCRQNVHRFTESCFTVASYRKAYCQTIHPVPDRTQWAEMSGGPESDDLVVNPPKSLRPPGQPRKRRSVTSERSQAKRVVRCSRCNQTGHFRTTCSTPI